MARKRWEAKTEITPLLTKVREKRKWQIALRRYVLEKNSSVFYAPYFGLDIENMRKWFENQFEKDTGWSDFAKKWQISHVIPVSYFDSFKESELKLCWNFTNLRVEQIEPGTNRQVRQDLLSAKKYFKELYTKTLYLPCSKMLEKIETIELSETISAEPQKKFLIENKTYLDIIENYSSFEFELLNSGRKTDEVGKEMAFLKKFDN